MSLQVNRKLAAALCAGVGTLAGVAAVEAQQAPTPPALDATELAKQTQNPVADLVAIPFQFNFNGGGDLEQKTFFNLNVQPGSPSRCPRIGS